MEKYEYRAYISSTRCSFSAVDSDPGSRRLAVMVSVSLTVKFGLIFVSNHSAVVIQRYTATDESGHSNIQ